MNTATPNAVLAELLARIGAAADREVVLAEVELVGWPSGLVASLKAHGFLVVAKPADSTTCPGCEQSCNRPVHWADRSDGGRGAFVLCDRRDDIHRVVLDAAALIRWCTGLEALGSALSELMGSVPTAAGSVAPPAVSLGLVRGKRGNQPVSLRVSGGRPVLAVAGHEIDVGLLLTTDGQRLVLDVGQLIRCAEQPGDGAAPGESPGERTARLQARKAQLVAKGVRGYVKQIAAEENLSETMVKRILYRKAVAAAASPQDATLAGWLRGASKPKKGED